MKNPNDIQVLRDLARQYADIAAKPVQERRRRLWRDHNSLRPTTVPILATYGMWNVWCRELFGDHAMKCQDPFYRNYERWLRMEIFHDPIGDDYIAEPWITVGAVQKIGWGSIFGLTCSHDAPPVEGGAWIFKPTMTRLDPALLTAPPHQIDEKATAEAVEKLGAAVGDILPVNVERGPACMGFMADISTYLVQVRGLEQLMIDMCDSPQDLHRVLAVMRDGIAANQAAAEAAGDIGMTTQTNQCMTYSHELGDPKPNVRGVSRKKLWAFCAAQEFTLISPAMHEEFLLNYQRPVMESWGLSAYGCCEDLTRKIDMLRKVKNLRIIAVTPRADVRRCAEQIGADYVLSWRPNPADMVCCGFDESKIRRIVTEALSACRGARAHIHLKDIETVEGDYTRLARWTALVRQLASKN